MLALINSCITAASLVYSIPERTIASIIKVESQFNSDAIGSLGEVGLMQIRPEYSKLSKKQLFNPCSNIFEGTKKLTEAKEECSHIDGDGYVICYNLGSYAGKKIRYPKLFPYYKKYRLAYDSLGE